MPYDNNCVSVVLEKRHQTLYHLVLRLGVDGKLLMRKSLDLKDNDALLGLVQCPRTCLEAKFFDICR